MGELERMSQEGGVKGLRAKNELEQMRQADLLAANKKEITAGAQKRKAERNANDGSFIIN